MTTEDIQTILQQHALYLGDPAMGKRADLQGVDLQGADLAGVDFRGVDFRGSDLRGVDFRGANLRGANLRDAHFQGANFQRANLPDTNFRDADLTETELRGVYFRNANLQGVSFEDASFEDVQFQGANLSGSTGLAWARQGPVGQGQRELLGWYCNDTQAIIIEGGCFRGTADEFHYKVSDEQNPPWEWDTSPENIPRWRTECLDTLASITKSIANRGAYGL